MEAHGVGFSDMTAWFWILTWLPLVLPALSQLPVPTNVTLNSNQLSYILKWEPGPGTPTGTYYHVSVGTERGTSDVPVSGCEHVQPPLICNMTEAFSDWRERYITKVTAHLGSLQSEAATTGFKPIDHLDLPGVKVTPCGRDLCVDLQPPLGHNLSYELQIRSTDKDKAQFLKDVRFQGRETLKDLAPGRQYCVSIRFADSLENKMSNFSHPVCAFTSGLFPTDPVISAAACSLVVAAVVFLVLLVSTGYIQLKKRQMPSVLLTIEHVEEVLVITSCAVSSFLNVWPTSTAAEEKPCRLSSSDESDQDCTTESVGKTSKRAYQQRIDTYLHNSSSSLSVSSSSSNQLSDVFDSQSKAQVLTESVEIGSLTRGQFQEGEVEHEITIEAGQDVNLYTLTFGRQKEVKSLHDTPQVDCLDSSDDITPVASSQTATDWCVEEEQEMDTSSGYMGRPHADD
ncbi:cytokine receptor family member b2 [Melanotaenia boesemani]|uniref:cytokine receptor family member b2 n=1 Tax=Melanotaenia boesemani TaxID=1250792 RepID=UPI001C059722|nr:cytokine receptor family member b2 [Melanotaenia boesemani]